MKRAKQRKFRPPVFTLALLKKIVGLLRDYSIPPDDDGNYLLCRRFNGIQINRPLSVVKLDNCAF